MSINPDNITTIRVDQLPTASIVGTNEIPVSVNSELKKTTIQDLANFISTIIGTSSAVGFLPISVTNGQQLPNVPVNPGFFFTGPGTYLNINGFADLTVTQELNVIMSLSDHWVVGAEIPINVDVNPDLQQVLTAGSGANIPIYINVSDGDLVAIIGISTNKSGVQGFSTNESGVYGRSTNADGIYGDSINGTGGTFRTKDGSKIAKFIQSVGGVDVIRSQVNADGGYELENGSKIGKGTTDEGTGGFAGIEQTCAIGYKWKLEDGEIYIRNQTGKITRKENARTAPTSANDNTKNYIVNSYWEMFDSKLYKCTDATTGVAVWELQISTSKPNKVATVTLSDIGIVTTTYTKIDLETAVTAYRQTLPMDVIYDIVVVKNMPPNFDVTSTNWGTLLTSSDWQAYFISIGATFATITNFSLVSGRVIFNIDTDFTGQMILEEKNITALNSINITGVTLLALGGNQITSLSGFTTNTDLLTIDFASNQITSLAGFTPNASLTGFYVIYNQINLQGYTDSESTVSNWQNGTAIINFSGNINSVIGTNLEAILISKGYTVQG